MTTTETRRVSTELPVELWGYLDQWAEAHDMTRPEAVRAAVERLIEDYHGQIAGLGQMLTVHPDLMPWDNDVQPTNPDNHGDYAGEETT